VQFATAGIIVRPSKETSMFHTKDRRFGLRSKSRCQSTRPTIEQLESRNLLSIFTPAQIRKAYQFNQSSYTGAGQTIAIVDAYNNPTTKYDLATFDAQFGLPAPPSYQKVNQYGGSSAPAFDAGWSLEIALDLEWAHAIAPQANLLLVEANSNSYSDLLTAVDYAAAHANIVSMSWGSGEFLAETGASFDGHFANHPSVTFVAAAGDSGAPPEWPSISPNVLAVGGTTLKTQSDGTYLSESAWSSGGGGISAYEPKPSYQSSVTQSATNRTGPDVAYNADPNTGYYVYDYYNGGWWDVGGTSAGAPQWAGLIALADQGRAASGKADLSTSDTLKAIYNMPAGNFHDITTGSNGFAAGSGYDLASGRGTPLANLVINSLVNFTSSTAVTKTSTTTTTTATTNTNKGKSTTFTEVQALLVPNSQLFQQQQVTPPVVAPVTPPIQSVSAPPVITPAATSASFTANQASIAGGVSDPTDALARPSTDRNTSKDRGIVPAEHQEDSEQVPMPAPATGNSDGSKADEIGLGTWRQDGWLAADLAWPAPIEDTAPPQVASTAEQESLALPIAEEQPAFQSAAALGAAMWVFSAYWQPRPSELADKRSSASLRR
jgi:hypothetical protein